MNEDRKDTSPLTKPFIGMSKITEPRFALSKFNPETFNIENLIETTVECRPS